MYPTHAQLRVIRLDSNDSERTTIYPSMAPQSTSEGKHPRDEELATTAKRVRLSPPQLDQLPVEIIWHIVSYISEPTIVITGDTRCKRRRKYDICSLRLTCRMLSDKVHEVFLRVAFSELEVDLVMPHLEALVEISRSERYSNAVKCLHFVLHEERPKHPSDAFEEEVEQRNYVEAGMGTAFLLIAMRNFHNVQTVKIKPVLWNPTRYRLPTSRSPNTTRLVSVVMPAILMSGSKLRNLVFTGRYNKADLTSAAMGCHVTVFNMPSQHLRVFDDLRNLDLHLAIRPSKKFNIRFDEVVQAFVSTSWKSLTSLSITFDAHLMTENVLSLLVFGHFPSLGSFRLEVVWSVDHEIEQFLTNNRQLKHLHLAHIDIRHASWTSVLGLLRERFLVLVTLQLRWLSESNQQISFSGEPVLSISSNENMMDSLRKAQEGFTITAAKPFNEPWHRYDVFHDDSDYDSDSDYDPGSG